MSAVIASIRLAAAHEGDAELIVRVSYDNGGSTDVSLDHHAYDALLTACNTQNPDDLIGQSWHLVRDALQHSYNRLQS